MTVSPPFISDTTFKYQISDTSIDFELSTDDLLEIDVRTVTVTASLKNYPYSSPTSTDSKSFIIEVIPIASDSIMSDILDPCRYASLILASEIPQIITQLFFPAQVSTQIFLIDSLSGSPLT